MSPAEHRLTRPLADLALRDDAVGGEELRAVAEATLQRLMPADDAFWIGVDFGSGSIAVTRGGVADPELAGALAPVVADDPIIRSFVADPTDLAPRRQSDVATAAEWQRTATCRLGFRDRPARYRLSSVYALEAPVRGFGWSAFRQDRDFSDRELETARAMHPLVSAIVAMGEPVWRRSVPGPLTPREVDVLRMLASGRTARAIATRRGIAEGTVRKHIEHIYDKLGTHDRVTAVAAGRRLGYL